MGTDIYLHAERRSGTSWQYLGELVEFETRHYEFYAILANVRNPIRSSEPFESITDGRGLPNDISEALQQDFLLACGHDPGWVLVSELQDFDWDGKFIRRSAVVDPTLAPLFGDGSKRFPRDQIPEGFWLANDGPGPRVTWTDSYKEAVGINFLDDLMSVLSKFGPAEEVRLVFSFDS